MPIVVIDHQQHGKVILLFGKDVFGESAADQHRYPHFCPVPERAEIPDGDAGTGAAAFSLRSQTCAEHSAAVLG